MDKKDGEIGFMTHSIRRANQLGSMTEGVIWQQLLLFFIPTWFGTLFQQLYNTADTVIVGRFVGTGALAAVGATSTLVLLVVGFATGLSSGSAVIISQLYGARRPEQVRRAVQTSIALALWLGGALTAAGLLLTPLALRAMGTPADIMADSVLYLRVYLLGMVPSLLYNMGTGVMRAVGDSRRPLYFLIAASVINILLDLVFVVVLGLGVLGVAAATILSQTISAVLVLACLRGAEGMPWQLEPGMPHLNRSLLSAILRIGMPAAVQSILYNISNIIIQGYINTFGTNCIAAWSVLAKLDGVYWMTIQSLGLSITTFAGQNFGARDYARLKKGTWQAVGLGLLFTLLIIALLLGLGRWMFLLFTPDLAVVEIGVGMVHYLAPWYLSYLLVEVLSGALRGAGDTFVPTLITCFGVCVLRVIWLVVMVPHSHTVETVMASYPITWCLASVLYLIYYLQGGWLRRRIAASTAAAAEG